MHCPINNAAQIFDGYSFGPLFALYLEKQHSDLSPEAFKNTKNVVRKLFPEMFAHLYGAKRVTTQIFMFGSTIRAF